jgi:phosphoserine phosphatase RsbU/P
MQKSKHVLRFFLSLGIISWIMLLVSDVLIVFSVQNGLESGVPPWLPNAFLSVYCVSLYIFFKLQVGKAERINFISLIWQVFVAGLLAAIVSLSFRLFGVLMANSRLMENDLLGNFLYHINLGLIISFLINTLVVWQRLILYQKSKRLLNNWQIFEYALLVSIILDFFNPTIFDAIFNTTLIVLLVLSVALSINLKWVAYLDFKQKLKSIIIMLAVSIFISYFITDLLAYDDRYLLPTNLLVDPFVLALFGFTFMYSFFSLLVIIFNLPTSSVFEQKLEEVINFQRLSQSVQAGYRVEQVYEILLESSLSAVFADAGWVNIEKNEYSEEVNIVRGITHEERLEVNSQFFRQLKDSGLNKLPRPGVTDKRYSSAQRELTFLQADEFDSVLWIPLVVRNKIIGNMVIMKEVSDGFNKEMVSIISTFASQASITVENYILLQEAIENERYQEELKIASKVQRSLLPKYPITNVCFDMVAFSEAADQVGGDYYDTMNFENDFYLIIGDVSGKGTSAAFNMSQMKGVFHSLVINRPSPLQFMIEANDALSRCLESASFITASLFIIDNLKKTIRFARAGHCPTLFYKAETNKACLIKGKGMGLGIVRDKSYADYMEEKLVHFATNDILFLYTDGITETADYSGEEFGDERLRHFLLKNVDSSPKEIKCKLLEELRTFSEGKPVNDDYSALIIKFK